MATTLTQFRARVRERADLVGDNFVTDAATSLDQWINDSISELYDLLIAASEDWYITSGAATVNPGASTFAVPTGMIRWRGLEVSINGELVPVPRGVFAERHSYSELRYVLTAATVRLYPAELAPGSYTAWYVPAFSQLVAGGDSFDGINGWEEYVVVDCALKAKVKGEDGTDDLMAAKAALLKRIQTMAGSRDGAEPPRIGDVHALDEQSPPWLW